MHRLGAHRLTPTVMETFKTSSVKGTVALGADLARRFGRGDCIGLVGELGAGKTVLVRGLAVGWGVEDERLISSPTYVLVQEYPGKVMVYHVDLYRMAAPASELSELGLSEMLEDGVVVVEWADRAEGVLPRPHWRIAIEVTGARRRSFSMERVE